MPGEQAGLYASACCLQRPDASRAEVAAHGERVIVKRTRGRAGRAWRRLKTNIKARLALLEIRLNGDRSFILGFWINRNERLSAAAVRADTRFIRVGWLSRNHCWTDVEVKAFLERVAAMTRRPTVIVWGLRDRRNGHDLKKLFPTVIRIEHGLIPGRRHKRLETEFILNRYGIYFDGRRHSDWEAAAQALKPGYGRSPAARALLDHVRRKEITKYPHRSEETVALKPGSLLILGQVNGDQAIEMTRTIRKSNLDFISWIYETQPVAGVTAHYYKPHPRNLQDNPAEIDLLKAAYPNLIVIDPGINVHRLLVQKPRVATMTSGAGLEAALHGCEVHTFGISFYSNFGFTADYFDCERRTNRLPAEDLASFMWMGWTVYVDPRTRRPVPVEKVFGLPGRAAQPRSVSG